MKNRGFTIVEALIIVVVVAIITALGLTAYHSFTKQQVATTQTTTAAPATVTEVKTASDLDKASSDLQALDLTDSSDTSTIDSQTSGF